MLQLQLNSSDRTSAEKKHLRILVIRSGRILPASFAGSPDFDEILGDFPASNIVGKQSSCSDYYYYYMLSSVSWFLSCFSVNLINY